MRKEMFVAALAFAQGASAISSTSASLPLSPSVVATTMTAVDSEGKGTLELLVLWRGRPGWFRSESGGSASGASGSGSGRGGSGGPDVRSAWLSEGGVSLSVRYEPSSRKVWIHDQEIDLNESNVVLVDDVDQSGGPRVVGALRVDPSYRARRLLQPQDVNADAPFDPSPVGVVPQIFVRRSPELIEYLRCSVGWPGAAEAETRAFEKWCAAAQP